MNPRRQESERWRRRHLWLSVFAPFLLTLLMALAGVAAVLLLPAPEQVALVADVMLTLLALCPAIALMFALALCAWALVIQMRRWAARAPSPLRRLEALTAAAHQRADGWLGRVDGQVLEWAVRLEPLRSLLTLFDAPPQASEDEADT
ncbi:MAG: hypothetical protein OXE95_09130 [Chloroflexi bacterium]|nr:hypothetical protein [Chloroflexota bacterium]MCY4247719.1 hypothetical protein [Chloroflexota bacterium]